MFLEIKKYSLNNPKKNSLNYLRKFKNEPGVSITAEWWQILTIITVILSIASIFLSINQAQPEAYRKEFIAIDQAKASVYLLYYESGQNDTEIVDFLEKPTQEKLCKEDFEIKLNTNDKNLRINEIRLFETKLQEIESDTNDKLNLLSKNSQIQNLFSKSNTYLVNKRLYFEKKYILAESLINIYQPLNKICLSNLKADEELDKITQSLGNISMLSAVNQDNYNKIYNVIAKWKTETDTIDLNAIFNQTKELETILSRLDNIDFFIKEYNTTKQDLHNEFYNLQQWQINFASTSPDLQGNLILIDEFSNASTK